MNFQIDNEKTLEIIERLKLAKIGEYEKWNEIIKKIKKNKPLDLEEKEYFGRLTRIYKESKIKYRIEYFIQNYQYRIKNLLVKYVI